MPKLLLALLALPLFACTTHDRVFYRNAPHKGHGLDNVEPRGSTPTDAAPVMPGDSPSAPIEPPVSDGAVSPIPS
jgi:hypothetical protein